MGPVGYQGMKVCGAVGWWIQFLDGGQDAGILILHFPSFFSLLGRQRKSRRKGEDSKDLRGSWCPCLAGSSLPMHPTLLPALASGKDSGSEGPDLSAFLFRAREEPKEPRLDFALIYSFPLMLEVGGRKGVWKSLPHGPLSPFQGEKGKRGIDGIDGMKVNLPLQVPCSA